MTTDTGRKRHIWLTNQQEELLTVLKKELTLNNSEVMRAGMEALAAKHSIKHSNINPTRNRG